MLIKVLALERRTFSKADSWAGVNCSLRSFPRQLLIYTARVSRALQLGLYAAVTGILDKEVKRRNTVLLYASFPAEQDKVKWITGPLKVEERLNRHIMFLPMSRLLDTSSSPQTI